MSVQSNADFIKAYNTVSPILQSCGTKISPVSGYDALIVKRLANCNTLDASNSCNQTHIDITGDQRDMFPFFKSIGYFNGNGDLKKFFVAQIDVTIFNSNVQYLDPNNSTIDFTDGSGQIQETKDTFTLTFRRTSQGQERVQVSIIKDDDKDFIAFRKIVHTDYYLILMRKTGTLAYDVFGIKNDVPSQNAELDKLDTKLFYQGNNPMCQVNVNKVFQSTKKVVMNKPRNLIFFGAPGTGKSYKLNQMAGELCSLGGEYERVTFHPDYSYAHFVGTYKPVGAKDKNSDPIIDYKFVPGPFTRVLEKALNDPNNPYLLLIEEINRANVAAVFGDVFQLLDRDLDSNGKYKSVYPIHTSEDMRKYLAEKFNKPESEFQTLSLPDNMFIWASMNSADQGVFPMDTAFKRRWDFEYIGIDKGEAAVPEKEYNIAGEKFTWNEIRHAINDKLLELGMNEDKLMGPFFISEVVLSGTEEDFIKAFKEKVLMYLFDDAAKHKRPNLFNVEVVKRLIYSEIRNKFDTKGMEIFNFEAPLKHNALNSNDPNDPNNQNISADNESANGGGDDDYSGRNGDSE